jgi:hypothetical protein
MTYGITWECYRSKWLAMYLELLACGDWIYVFLDSDLLCMWKLIFDADCLAVKVYWLWNYIWNDSIWLAMRMELDGNANSWCGILGMKLHCLCTLVELCNIAVCLLTNVLSKVRKFIAILDILDLADFLRNSFVVTVDSSNQPVLVTTLVSMELKNTTCFINTHKTQMWLKHDP